MRRVVVLAEAAEDLQEAKKFYDDREAGVGAYCVTSLMADRREFGIRGACPSGWLI